MNKTASKECLFQTVNLQKFYPQTQSFALRDVNLTISEGEFVGIRGPSGSGKSTLLYLLSGLLTPSSGEIYFRGKPLENIKNKALYRRKNIGFVFQDFYLYPGFSVLENVLLPCLHKFFIPASLIKKAQALLEYLHIAGKKDLPVETLSAGERQRVCISRALLCEPRCILADEPTGNLDSENSRNILGLLQKINDERKTAVILVTNDDKISSFAHRIVHIVDGTLKAG